MRHFLKHTLSFVREQLTHWSIVAAVLLLTGFLPDHWIEALVEQFRASSKSLPISVSGIKVMAVIVGVAIVVGDVLTREIRAKKASAGIRADLKVVFDDDFPHAPMVRVRFEKTGRGAVRLTRLEFETKGHWDIPDPRQTGSGVPVVSRLPPGTRLIKISPEVGSIAPVAVGVTLKPKQRHTIEFTLVTDHSPADGIGIFPYHLGCELVYGSANAHLRLPDMLVSLHGILRLTATEYGGPAVWQEANPRDNQKYANAALSRLSEGVICPEPVRNALAGVVSPGGG